MDTSFASTPVSVPDAETTRSKIHSFLLAHGVTEDAEDFIGKLSNVYHRFESTTYDKYQVSLHSSEKSWQSALAMIEPMLPEKIRVLDYGAGTGFATLQALHSPLAEKVTDVVCYDLSPAMLELCRQNVKTFSDVSFKFLSLKQGESELLQEEPFDLVLTNSLIHHIYDLPAFFQNLKALIKPGGFYVAGHEPNRRFYTNDLLIQKTRTYQRYKRIKQRFFSSYWAQKLGLRKGNPDLASLTNGELMRANLITKPIPARYLYKMIDIHVPFGLTLNQPWGIPGFSADLIQKNLLGDEFQVAKAYTYSHIKDGTVANDWYWRKAEEKLSLQFPADGADCLMVFRRMNEK